MQNVMSPLVTMYQTQLEASRRFADAVFSGTEKIDRVMIDATHRVVSEQINLAEAMTNVRDAQTAGSTLQSSFFAGNRNNAIDYQKEIMRIIAEMQNEIGRSWQDYVQQLRTQASSSAARPLEAVQTRANDTVFNPMTSMFSVWESAFKEVADLARKNMTTARTMAGEASGRTLQQASSYADTAAAAVQEATKSVVEAASAATAHAAKAVDSESSSDEKRGPTSGGGKKK